MVVTHRKTPALASQYDAYTELNAARSCDFPQVERVEQIVATIPNACFVLTLRSAASWVASMRNFHARTKNDSLATEMLRACHQRNLRNKRRRGAILPTSERGLTQWYDEHVRRAKSAILSASCSLVLDIEQPLNLLGSALAARFPGTRSACWRHSHSTSTLTSTKVVQNQTALLAAGRP
jgi:hypothetical protein